MTEVQEEEQNAKLMYRISRARVPLILYTFRGMLYDAAPFSPTAVQLKLMKKSTKQVFILILMSVMTAG